ncbi:DUF1615 family protein, partial [Aeromonas salmonicida]|uniref:DUF1615 family protein n=1 Tax=Aeromonas salmonicida TaxID=645 RepID=UPI003D318381
AMKRRIFRFFPLPLPSSPFFSPFFLPLLSMQVVTVIVHNVCTVLAVAEQEATYQADPVVPGLGKIERKERKARDAKLLIPKFVVRTALGNK